jgi:outer membrane protein assembly factor BamB
MALFGYFCSPFCKSKAEAANIQAPVYEGLSSAVEARFWRKTGLIFGAIATVVVLVLAAGGWYVFYGALPHAVLTLPFDQRASAGQCRQVGADQLLFLHGGTLARCDLKTKKTVWSHELLVQNDADAVVARLSEMQNGVSFKKSGAQLETLAWAALQSRLSLWGGGSNVWLSDAARLTHYDWETGRELQSIPLGENHGILVAGEGELLVMRESDTGAKFVTHISYTDGGQRTEEFHETGKLTVATGTSSSSGAGLPSANGRPGQPLDPSKVAEQAQNLTTPGRLALSALLANNIHQQQLMEEMNEEDKPKPKPPGSSPTAPPSEDFLLVPSRSGFVQYTVKMLERNFVSRSAMKAPSGKSIINGNLNAGQGTEAANEVLNDMQRANGGDQVVEDQSRYQIILRRPDVPEVPDWSGEVIGFPTVYSLKTVNVIAADKSVTVFDKANKKLWEASLTYEVAPSRKGLGGEESPLGECPCAEEGDTLYVVDQAVLTAFDLAAGNARWRLPSVGIVGLHFDGAGMIYVNTTTANPDKIKYSRQIDIAENIDSILLKVDAKTGRNLWTAKTGGFACYVFGPFLYTMQSHDRIEDDMASDLTSGLQKAAFLKIFRLDPKNGHTLWEYDDTGAPLDVCFDKNIISLVFHTQVEVLKYLSL